MINQTSLTVSYLFVIFILLCYVVRELFSHELINILLYLRLKTREAAARKVAKQISEDLNRKFIRESIRQGYSLKAIKKVLKITAKEQEDEIYRKVLYRYTSEGKITDI